MNHRRIGTIVVIGWFALLGLMGLVKASRAAEMLQPAAPPTDWTSLGIALLVGAAIVAAIWYLRHNPGAKAKAEAEAAKAKDELGSVVRQLGDAIHRLAESHAAITAAPGSPTPAPAEAPASPAPAAGKNGVAGVFSLPVTGDPKADLAAINSAYFS